MNPQSKDTILSKSVPLWMSATNLGIPRPPALWSQLATNSGVPSIFLRLDDSLEWLKKALYLVLHGYKVHLGFSIRSQTNFLANPILQLHHEVYSSGQTDTHNNARGYAWNNVPSFQKPSAKFSLVLNCPLPSIHFNWSFYVVKSRTTSILLRLLVKYAHRSHCVNLERSHFCRALSSFSQGFPNVLT